MEAPAKDFACAGLGGASGAGAGRGGAGAPLPSPPRPPASDLSLTFSLTVAFGLFTARLSPAFLRRVPFLWRLASAGRRRAGGAAPPSSRTGFWSSEGVLLDFLGLILQDSNRTLNLCAAPPRARPHRLASTALFSSLPLPVLSTSGRLYVGRFGTLFLPAAAVALLTFLGSVLAAPSVDIDGIREPVAGSLLYGNNLISASVLPSSNAVGVHFFCLWDSEADEWFFNGGAYQLIALHFFAAACCWMGREWELSYRLGMRPWIFAAFSGPVAASGAVFVVYPLGQGSFSDGLPLGVDVDISPRFG